MTLCMYVENVMKMPLFNNKKNNEFFVFIQNKTSSSVSSQNGNLGNQ